MASGAESCSLAARLHGRARPHSGPPRGIDFAAEQLQFAALREESEGGRCLRSSGAGGIPESRTGSSLTRTGGDERCGRDAAGSTHHAPSAEHPSRWSHIFPCSGRQSRGSPSLPAVSQR